MKILFICGTLEPGQDGVGDYSRRLGAELTKQNYEVSIIAFNDHFVTGIKHDLQQIEGIFFPVLRLPYNLSRRKRIKTAKAFIAKQNPDWISLQYVPYAFQNKGLPYLLTSELKVLGRGRKWHIMFHELWVGSEDGQFLKMKIIAALQKFIIRRMITSLCPSVIHTHLPLYQDELDKLGSNTLDLALFSNIINFGGTRAPFDKNIVRISFFSQVEINLQIIEFLQKLKKKVIEDNKKLEVLLIGGSKEKMAPFANRIKTLLGTDTIVNYTGFLSAQEISKNLRTTSLGITPIPEHALGKSGSIAAFFEHEVPVAVPVVNKTAKPFFNSTLFNSLIFTPNLDELASATKAAKEARKLIDVSFIAKKLIKDLV